MMVLNKFDSYDFFYERCIDNTLTWSFLPRKCYRSGKSIWFTKGYKLTARYVGPGDVIHEYRWFDKKEFMLGIISGDIPWDR